MHEASADVLVVVNTLWVLIASFLVFFMNAGFALLESGLCRAKNTVNILAKNFMVFGLGMVGYWSLGYALMFGPGNGFAGAQGWFLTGLGAEMAGLPLEAHFLFQLCFAVTAATIVSGAVAERIKVQSYMAFAVLLTAVVYPIVGHWAWGDGGWLAAAGFADFAGSTVVHSVGGWSALVGAWLLGPRIGKYSKDGRVQPIPGHNIALVTLGGLILWLGWFGFNGGSDLKMSSAVAHISTTTALAAALGTVTATMYAWWRVGKPDLTLIINGMLGGLVGITAGAKAVALPGAAVIGAAAGVLVIESVVFFDRRRIDDPVGAISVHLVCGMFGTLMVGFFARETGLLYGHGAAQLVAQVKGIAAVGGFVSGAAFVLWLLLRHTLGLRVPEDEEMVGLDLAEMGMEAYPNPSDRSTVGRGASPSPLSAATLEAEPSQG